MTLPTQTIQDIQRISEKWAKASKTYASLAKVLPNRTDCFVSALAELATPLTEKIEKLEKESISLAKARFELNQQLSTLESQNKVLVERLEKTVCNLADAMEWNWTKQGLSERDAADAVLRLMAKNNLITHREHPSGGSIWQVNGRIYGRTDGVKALSSTTQPTDLK